MVPLEEQEGVGSMHMEQMFHRVLDLFNLGCMFIWTPEGMFM